MSRAKFHRLPKGGHKVSHLEQLRDDLVGRVLDGESASELLGEVDVSTVLDLAVLVGVPKVRDTQPETNRAKVVAAIIALADQSRSQVAGSTKPIRRLVMVSESVRTVSGGLPGSGKRR